MAYASITLTGTYLHIDGAPAVGTIEIRPTTSPVRDTAGDVVLAGGQRVSLDDTGAFSIDLPATDDPGLDPTGFGYTVTPRLHHENLKAVTFGLPGSLESLDMADVTPADPAVNYAPVLEGPSAFDVAVRNGFTGDETEWLASLVGPASTVPGPAGTTTWAGITDKPTIPATADDIGAETPAGAQSKADAAETAANAYTDTGIAGLADTAPAALDTLNELAAALGDDPNFATTVLNQLATKAAAADVDTLEDLTSSGRLSNAQLSATYAPRDRIGPRATVALIGSSITAQNGPVDGSDAGSSPLRDATGYWHWANIQLGQRIDLTAQKGVGGNTTTQMAARFDADILALNPTPGWLLIEPGPNDAGASDPPIPAATTIANLTTMLDKAVKAGMRPILATVTPSSFMTSVAQKQARSTVNQWIKKTAPTLYPGLVVVDWAAAMVDATTGGPNSAYFKNETGNFVHPNNQGAAHMGEILAAALAPVAPAVDKLVSDPADPYNLVTNPFLVGSASGVATGLTITKLDGSAIAGTASKVPRVDGIPGEWQQVALTGSNVQAFWQNTNVGTDWVAGTDRVQGLVEFETDNDWVTVKYFTALIEFYNGLGASYAMSVRSADGNIGYNPMRGVLRTPAALIPTGTTRIRLKLLLELVGGVGKATFRFSRGDIRKVA